MTTDSAPLWQQPEADQIKARAEVVGEVGVGWVEMAFLPVDRYRVRQRGNGWAVFTYDEQQAGWDREHDLG